MNGQSSNQQSPSRIDLLQYIPIPIHLKVTTHLGMNLTINPLMLIWIISLTLLNITSILVFRVTELLMCMRAY